jgi:hypothetical protein
LSERSSGFTSTLLDATYRVYLNHAKVIHWRDGRPVYSLSTPALFSGASANFLARTLYRTIQNRNLPNMMSLAVTDICNAKCEHCSFFSGRGSARGRSHHAQMTRVIHDAQELGVPSSPRRRRAASPGPPQIIGSRTGNRRRRVMFTNGTLLAERAASLRRSGLDSIYVSIDSCDPA